MIFSSAADFDQAYTEVQATFAKGVTKDKKWRRLQLKRAFWMLEDNKDRICAALATDLHKHPQEAYPGDYRYVQMDILEHLKYLDEWTKDEFPARTNLLNFLGNTTVRKEPLGVTLIIGAWNYPLLLLLQPMIAAISAGCAIILKPSDLASTCQDLLMDIIPKYLDPNAIRCITAGPKEMGYILEHRFDHIFYTGSPGVAKIIYNAAARYLTPVTLELGGQGPAIVTESADIDLAAKRIAGMKFTNAGQICLNVNHVLAHPTVKDQLVERLAHWFDVFRGGKGVRPDYYTHIINDRNFDRLESLLKTSSGKIFYGGDRDRSTRYFSPTIVVNVDFSDSLLSQELFGPILPIVEADFDTAIQLTRASEHPLAIYAFTHDKDQQVQLLSSTQSGGVTFNDCALHANAHDAPFGGVGTSGLGYYHGRHGILAFSHLRTYMHALPTWMEGLMSARYPPYTLAKVKKLAPDMAIPFDRDGNDIPPMGRFTRWTVAILAAVGIGAVVLTQRQLPAWIARIS